MNKHLALSLTLLLSTPAVFAVDEIVRAEKIAAREVAVKAAEAAVDAREKNLKAAKDEADYKKKTVDYVVALGALRDNARTISEQEEIIKTEEAKKATPEIEQAIKAAKTAKEAAEGKTAGLQTDLDKAAKEVSAFVPLFKACEVADIKFDVARAEEADFNAQEELEEAKAEYEVVKTELLRIMAECESATLAEHTATLVKAFEAADAELKIAREKCAFDGDKLLNAETAEAKDFVAAQNKVQGLQAKLEEIKKFAVSAEPTIKRYEAAVRLVKGSQYDVVFKAERELLGAQVTLKANKNDAQKDALTKAVTEAEKALKEAEEAYNKLPLKGSEQELGTERYAKLKNQELAKVDSKANFISRFFGFGFGKVKAVPGAIKGAGVSVWKTWFKPGYDENHFKATTFGYAPAAADATKKARLNAFKAALTKQGVDYSTSFGRTVYPSLGLGALAGLAGTGIAYKFFGQTAKTAAIGAGAGLGTTILASLYLAGRHGVGYVTGAYAERRKHILDTAKADGITADEALKAYNDVCGKSNMKALRKFGMSGLSEMKSLAKQMKVAVK